MDILTLLLDSNLPDISKDLPTAQFEVQRLSKLAGAPIVFTLRALPYGRINELRKISSDETDIDILLAGCVEPSLKEKSLLEKFDAPTPAELVRSMLLPGEIADLSIEVEKLSGYRRRTITDVKNG